MVNEINVYFAHTPLHIYLIEKIIKLNKINRNYLFLEFENTKQLNINEELFESIIRLDDLYIGDNIRFQNGNKIINEILLKLDKFTAGFESVNIFMSDIKWLLNNNIYHRIIKKDRDKYKFINFPDGFSTMTITKTTLKDKIKFFLKSIYGHTFGTKYYYYNSDLLGLSLADEIYSLEPKLLNVKTNVRNIELRDNVKVNQRKGIFLSQAITNLLPKESYIEFIQNVAIYLNNLGLDKIYYKPHHFEQNKYFKEIESILEQHNITIIINSRCAEELISDENIGLVVSFNSSALFNLKLMFGDDIKCISFKFNEILKSSTFKLKEQELTKSKELFDKFNVEIIN